MAEIYTLMRSGLIKLFVSIFLVFTMNDYDQNSQAYAQSTFSKSDRQSKDLDRAKKLNENFLDLFKQGRYSDAEVLGLEILKIHESTHSLNHLETAEVLNNLAVLYDRQGHYTKAEHLFIRALSIREATLGDTHPDTALSLNNLAGWYYGQADYVKAEPLLVKALSIRENSVGRAHPDTAQSLNNLASLYVDQGAYGKAEPLYVRALAIREATLGPNDPDTANSLNNLAFLYENQSEYAKAEPLYIRALSINEATLGLDHPDTADSLISLARSYVMKGAYLEAETLFIKALSVYEALLGPDHPDIAASLNSLAYLYINQGNYSKAEPLLVRSLSIYETALGPNHPHTATILNNLASLYSSQGAYAKAEPLYIRNIDITEAAMGTAHPDTATSISNLAGMYYDQSDFEKAQPLFSRALVIRQAAFNLEHFDTAVSLGSLAQNYESQGNHIHAHKYFKLAATAFERRALLTSGGDIWAQTEASRELKNNVWYFYKHALASYQLQVRESVGESQLIAEAYSSSQYALRTSAGAALKQAAARFATADDALANVVRGRQDLVSEWAVVNERLRSSIGTIREDRNIELEQSYRDKLIYIDMELKEFDQRLEADFPEYFALTSPKPLRLEETQELLYDNEALVMFLVGDGGTLVFAVTKDKVDWSLVDINASVLEEAVRVLRGSLENPQHAFPRGQAHGVYKKLMDDIEGLVSEKNHLFLVPSGALGSIPLGVLVTDEPEGTDSSPEALRATKWWGTRQALTTLPSVSSLKALRLLAKDGRGKEPFAGFGNPVLEGPTGDQNDRSINLASRGTASYFRGKYGDVEAIRTLAPLPKTKTELMSLASAMQSKPKQSLWLGDRATETNLKAADLSEKRVLAFATHGLMSGEMSGLSEPALVLTPPDEATEHDDGLLTASEAALLTLNADWVILSACNTAAAEEPGADGLSGLARSFFYAGARSMLVSHWPVRDDAAARLTTTAISIKDANPEIGRAEALRRSMLVLMNDSSDPSLAHPASWAPFVIVGEGGSPVSANSVDFDPNNYKGSSSKGQTSPMKLITIFSGVSLLLVFGFRIVARRKRQTSHLN